MLFFLLKLPEKNLQKSELQLIFFMYPVKPALNCKTSVTVCPLEVEMKDYEGNELR